MKNSKSKGALGLIIVFLALIGFGYLSFLVINNSASSLGGSTTVATASNVGKINLGLDLAGGVSITYQTVEEDPSDEDMADTVYKLQQRVQNYSTEAEVYREGDNRINIDIPGVSDANAILDELGQPGSLYFMDPNLETVLLTGDQVADAQAGIVRENNTDEYIVQLTFTEEGATIFAEATETYLGQAIAIVYDDTVISYPTVNQVITGGQAQITGMTTYEDAQNLASSIRIGSLSLELEELRSNVVGAKLGAEAVHSSVYAAIIGFAILVVFMIAIYLLPGVASIIALALYVALMLCLLAAFDVTLTLPGIAGIILSIGMAVDANVIIFTRIKEEIGLGKTVEAAIKLGFEKALSAIIDGNVTTLIAATVLYLRGSGTVKGFATTLAIGIILSMFTALFITKQTLQALYRLGLQSPKLYGFKKDGKIFDFLGKRKLCIALSLVVILAGVAGMGINIGTTGSIFNYGIDFKGGTSTSVTFNEDMTIEEISEKVVPVVEAVTGEAGTQTQKVEGTTEVIIKTRTLTADEREALNNALAENFGIDAETITAESISGAVSTEMKQDAAFATIIATVLMLLYIWFRFKDIRFAASSVLALTHDVLVVIAFYAILKWSVGSTFIACILTIVGYSINATIVIFDRIRENKTLLPRASVEEIINTSITQTLSRSINSSLTTFIMVFVLYILGGSSIREFALPIMVGIVCGTYSSIFLASSFWYMANQAKKKKAKK